MFMQLINKVLHEHLFKGVLVYLNDILMYIKTMDKHIKLVETVLQKLLAAQFFVKLSKYKFHQPKLDYPGCQISHKGVEMDLLGHYQSPAQSAAHLGWEHVSRYKNSPNPRQMVL